MEEIGELVVVRMLLFVSIMGFLLYLGWKLSFLREEVCDGGCVMVKDFVIEGGRLENDVDGVSVGVGCLKVEYMGEFVEMEFGWMWNIVSVDKLFSVKLCLLGVMVDGGSSLLLCLNVVVDDLF